MSVELPQIGDTLAERYELLDTLGEGGMSVVFRVRDRHSGRELALKLLTPRYLGRPEREQRLLDEARYLERLRGQPGVVSLIDHGRLDARDNWPFLVTTLLEGRALNWMLIKHSFAGQELRELSMALARAIATCHARGIVHRDLTPSNVSVSLDPIRVELFDFSHASSSEHPSGAPTELDRLTGVFDVPGTSGYMGPEQAHSAPADTKMDVFAFGVLLYEVISGRNPYPKVSHSEFIELQRNGALEAPNLHAWAYDVHTGWSELISACTDADPTRRPAMHELPDRLEAIPLHSDEGESTDRVSIAEIEARHASERALVASESAPLDPDPSAIPVPRESDQPTTRMPIAEIEQRAAPPGVDLGAWGPPPGSTPAAPRTAAARALAPRAGELQSKAATATEPHSAPVQATLAAPEASPALAFARPDAPRIDFDAPSLAPATSLAVDDPSQPANETERASRRGLIAVLLLLSLALGGLGLWVVFGSGAHNPSTPQAPATAEDTLETTPPKDPTPEGFEVVPVPVPAGPMPDVKSKRPATSKRANKVKPPPDSHQPSPAPPPDDCEGTEAAAQAAKAARDWNALIGHTARATCWSSAQTRILLRVEALAQAKRFAECLSTAEGHEDPKLERWVSFCGKNI